MNVRQLVEKYYSETFNSGHPDISALSGSGSDRKYFRVVSDSESIIAVYNNNREENDAFVKLSEIFSSKGLAVPRVLKYFPDQGLYFQSDLGDTTLYSWLISKRISGDSDTGVLLMYKAVLDQLVKFQVNTIDAIDLDICYPNRSFDRQSMLWDMNYFKDKFLNLVEHPFNKDKLYNDFISLADRLSEAGQDFFLYRDFQSANIMIQDASPWFIDFQGGRGGAPQYDVASLLYDSKACIPQNVRDELLNHYLDSFCSVTNYSREKFNKLYPAFVLIRIMQAMGAYGLRGIIEKKDGFAQSIAPAIRDLNYIIKISSFDHDLPELGRVVKSLELRLGEFELM